MEVAWSGVVRFGTSPGSDVAISGISKASIRRRRRHQSREGLFDEH